MRFALSRVMVGAVCLMMVLVTMACGSAKAFDGQLVVETTDDTFHAGKVGLWTKVDSTSCFDDAAAKAP